MPIYDYLCVKCGHEYEGFFSPGETVTQTFDCPHGCGHTGDKLPPLTSYRGNFGGGSTPKRPNAHMKQTAFNFDKEKK